MTEDCLTQQNWKSSNTAREDNALNSESADYHGLLRETPSELLLFLFCSLLATELSGN
jgi:hypothetical protein